MKIRWQIKGQEGSCAHYVFDLWVKGPEKEYISEDVNLACRNLDVRMVIKSCPAPTSRFLVTFHSGISLTISIVLTETVHIHRCVIASEPRFGERGNLLQGLSH
jgi:hypothetical protein